MNNENDNLDISKPKTEKEYYVKKLEKYEELDEKIKKDIFIHCMITTISIVTIGMFTSNLVVNPEAYYISSVSMSVCGALCLTLSLASVACSIAKKAGLENRIMELNEALELYELQSNQSYEDIGKSNKVKGKHPNEYRY